MEHCIFCEIADKEVAASIVYEGKEILGFKTNKPEAPVHLLFIPKKHLEWKDEFSEKDLQLLAELLFIAKKIAIEKKIFGACKFIFNVGKTGHIPHIHVHLLGGWNGETPMHNI